MNSESTYEEKKLKLSTDTYTSIKFAILIACLLGSVFTILTQKISFRQKTISFIFLFFSTIGLLTYLETTYNDDNFILYVSDKIKCVLGHYFSGYKLLAYEGEITFSNIFGYIVGLTFFGGINTLLYMFPRYILKFFFFHNNYEIMKKAYNTKPSYWLLNCIIWIIDWGCCLTIYSDYENEMDVYFNSASYPKTGQEITVDVTINILLLYIINAFISMIGSKYIAESLKEGIQPSASEGDKSKDRAPDG